MGNGEAKELIFMTHGHDLKYRTGMMVGGGYRAEGNKGEKIWNNCNSIISKTYLKYKKK